MACNGEADGTYCKFTMLWEANVVIIQTLGIDLAVSWDANTSSHPDPTSELTVDVPKRRCADVVKLLLLATDNTTKQETTNHNKT